MQKTCRQCSAHFEIYPEDLAFYDKVSPVFNGKKELIPPPSLCPECRQKQRLAFRNERTYFHRACDRCKQKIISQYPVTVSFPVYCSTCYWGDGWDAKEYGAEFDESKPFYTQYFALQERTPRIAFSSSNNENSDFCNHAGYMKNCYLVIGSIECQDSYYCTRIFRSKNCVDCLFLNDCELCFDTTNCDRCYEVRHAYQCKDVRSSSWIRYCNTSHDLLFCVNRRHASCQILNEQFSLEDFQKERDTIMASPSLQRDYFVRFQTLCLSLSVPASITHLSEQCDGNFLSECQQCKQTFDATRCQDIFRGYDIGDTKDCEDVYSFYESELCYESYSGYRLFNCIFNRDCWPGANLLMCDHCFFGCSHCLGCISLQKQSYCILNKQYSRDEYGVLAQRIIEHMKKTGEWGEFFPMQHSQFAYNESAVGDYFPMTKDEVLARGWKWRDQTDEMPKVEKIIPAAQLPDSIDDVPDDILNWAIECEATKRPFKIIKQELAFYRQMRLSVPHFHPDERHRKRMALRNPRKLWDRECAKCRKLIMTSYSPERPEIVYCEECYLKEVY